MTTPEKKFTMSKPLGALIITLLAGAFFAGTKARITSEPAVARSEPSVALAGIVPPVVEAVTAEQVRTMIADMRELRSKLDDATKQVGQLNERLARLEGACASTCGR